MVSEKFPSEDENLPRSLDERPSVPRNPDTEKYIAAVYERNRHAEARKNSLLDLLDSDSFSRDTFDKVVASWNDHEEQEKGFRGFLTEMETIYQKNGTLRVFHFRESDSVKFGFIFSK
ncbi:MAG: hypothetical protein AAB783_01225 [Patescibacteria group bacterium]